MAASDSKQVAPMSILDSTLAKFALAVLATTVQDRFSHRDVLERSVVKTTLGARNGIDEIPKFTPKQMR